MLKFCNEKFRTLFLLLVVFALILVCFNYKNAINDLINGRESSIMKEYEKIIETNVKANSMITKLTNIAPEIPVTAHKKRHVFFDLGTNDGESVRNFIEVRPKKDTDGIIKGYGTLDNKKWEIYAVEANPYFNKILNNLKRDCEALGHTLYLYTETAAWTKNEKLVFYLDTVNVHGNFWGSSLLKYHRDVVSSGYKNVTVNGIDIAELLRKYTKEDEIVLKIDIEGTEYPLLMHLIKEHVLDLVDIIAVEFHRDIVKDIPIKEMEEFFVAYFKFMEIRTNPWY